MQNASTPQTQPASWLQRVPLRISNEALQGMISKFKSNHSAEILDVDSTPSIRLISMVADDLKPGNHIKCIPWQLRLSQMQYTDAMEAKSRKAILTATQLIASVGFWAITPACLMSKKLSAVSAVTQEVVSRIPLILKRGVA